MLVQYRERIIFIGQNIDEEFSNQILATMLYLDSVDNSKRMYMYINGPGGDVSCLSLFSVGKSSIFIFYIECKRKYVHFAAYSKYGYL